VPSEDIDTEYADESIAASPSMSAPTWVHVPPLSAYTRTWPAVVPAPSFPVAPIATRVPSEDIDIGKEFNQDLSKWDVSKVTKMQYMFFHSGFDQDITGWNTASLPNDRASYRMFTGDSAWYRKYGRAGWSSGDMNGPPSAWHKKA
jgi:surface protein